MRLTYIRNGDTLALDASRCRGCRTCVDVCPHAVFAMVDGTSSIVDRAACMECGACARNCAHGAITVKAGVGCAAAVIGGLLKGTEPTCGGSGSSCGCGGGRPNATFGGSRPSCN